MRGNGLIAIIVVLFFLCLLGPGAIEKQITRQLGVLSRWTKDEASPFLPFANHAPCLTLQRPPARSPWQEQNDSVVRSETLLRSSSSWDGVVYKAYPSGTPELTVLKITIPPHQQLPWHLHSMPNAGFVVSGEITVEEPNGEQRHFSTGDVIPETVDTFHRGRTDRQAAVLLVFYAGVKGMPLAKART